MDDLTNVKIISLRLQAGPHISAREIYEHHPFFPFLSPSMPTSGARVVVMGIRMKEKLADSAAGEGRR